MGKYFDKIQDSALKETETQDKQALFSRFSKTSLLLSTHEELLQNRKCLYDVFSSSQWNQLDNDLKCQAIQALENDFAFQQGRPAKEVKVEPMEDACFGYWNPHDNKIFINKNLVENGTLFSDEYATAMPDANMQIFDTIAHEGYHAYQSYALDNPHVHADKNQLREWSLNRGKYYDRGDKYLIQPKERDAWQYGYQATTTAFQGIELRNGPEPGLEEYQINAEMSSYQNALQRELAHDPDILMHMEQEMERGCIEKGISYDYSNSNALEATPEKTNTEQIPTTQSENEYLGDLNTTEETTSAENYMGFVSNTFDTEESEQHNEYLGEVYSSENSVTTESHMKISSGMDATQAEQGVDL